MTLRNKVNRLENKVRLDIKAKNKASFFERFVNAHGRGMVLCNDGKDRPFGEWAKLRGIDQHLAEVD